MKQWLVMILVDSQEEALQLMKDNKNAVVLGPDKKMVK